MMNFIKVLSLITLVKSLHLVNSSGLNLLSNVSVIHEDDCSTSPNISVTLHKRNGSEVTDELWYIADDQFQVSGADIIEMRCASRKPIQWIFNGVNNPSADVINMERRRIRNSTQVCFLATIQLQSTKQSTGQYRCEAIDKSSKDEKYIYGDGNGPPFLLNDGQNINIVSNGIDPIILPCQVVSHKINTTLYKGYSHAKKELRGVPYNPEIGYVLDLKTIDDPYDIYECRDTFGRVTINVAKLPSFSVTPTGKAVIVEINHFISLTCNSRTPVYFEGNSDKTLNAVSDSDYEYGINVNFQVNENSIVSCVDSVTNDVLHTWNISVVRSEEWNSQGIFYNSSMKSFICRSEMKEPPTMILAECSNPTNCKFKEKCPVLDAPYTIDGNRNGNCPGIVSDTPCIQTGGNSCAHVYNTFEAGIVFCLPKSGLSHQMLFFKGIGRGRPVISQWNSVSNDQLIQVEGPNPNETVYVGEPVTFTCTAVKFVFAHGFIWKFQSKNGSLTQGVWSSNTTGSIDAKSSIISEFITLKMPDRDIAGVICFVPFWNTTKWANSTFPVHVEIGVEPTILVPEDDTLELTKGTNNSLECRAEGIRRPELIWYKNGQEIASEDVHIQINSNISISSWIDLRIVDEDEEGIYTCIASNFLSQANRTVYLSVAENTAKGKFLAIVGLILFFGLLGIVFAFMKKNKELVEEREMEVDLQKYEIHQEALLMENAVRIGTGQFGEVLKCKLNLKRSSMGCEPVDVAVKRTLGPNGDPSHFKSLYSEYKIICHVGGFDNGHSNIISLWGAVTNPLKCDIHLVLEYCQLGSLADFFKENGKTFLNQIRDGKIDLSNSYEPVPAALPDYYLTPAIPLSTFNLLTWAKEIASGMIYLKKKRVIHGDLAIRNILLTGDQTVKISDFGLSVRVTKTGESKRPIFVNTLSRIFPCARGSSLDASVRTERICSSSTGNMELPWRYLSPEVELQHSKISFQSDIWAYGVLLWEMFTLGKTPHEELDSISETFWSELRGGTRRLPMPKFANHAIYDQMLLCWHIDPKARTTFKHLWNFFNTILEK